MRLDRSYNPGLTNAQLQELLTTCDTCKLAMTCRVFPNHDCVALGVAAGEVIDLTIDSD
jgi:hypothetical protein